MTETSYPFDAGAGAAINEAQWQQMARRFRQTGVIDGSLNKLLVSADGSALSVSVATGDAFVEGFFYRNDAALAKTIATAHATNPRIDTVVVRLDRVANTATLQVITGTPAASPVAPALSQTDSLYELPLANVLVPAAAGVIVAGNVTDRRTLTQTFDSAAYVLKADQTVWLGVGDLETLTGGPARAAIAGSRVLAWLLDAAAEESVSGSYDAPDSWTSVHVDLWWTNAGAGAGNVVFTVVLDNAGDGVSLSATGPLTTVTVAAPGVNVVKVTRVITNQALTMSNFLSCRVIRNAPDAADTLANDAAILGIRITKAA